MFILTRVLCSTIEYNCMNMVLYKLINFYIYICCSPDVKSQEVYCAHFADGSPEQRVFEEQSARDWETFLLCRAKELVPGNGYTRICSIIHHVISEHIHCKVTFHVIRL